MLHLKLGYSSYASTCIDNKTQKHKERDGRGRERGTWTHLAAVAPPTTRDSGVQPLASVLSAIIKLPRFSDPFGLRMPTP